jgi:hypothetical protein|tara:strand:+ start:1030 stop:1179 length:150 start_codon:yes stop_codon:yes gene_type:complete
MSLQFLQEPWFWIVFTAASELIGISKLKDNSVLELVLNAIRRLKPVERR